MKEHQHTCQACQYVWSCFGIGKGKICEVNKAAQVNKQGPFCTLCQSLIMAMRHTRGRAACFADYIVKVHPYL